MCAHRLDDNFFERMMEESRAEASAHRAKYGADWDAIVTCSWCGDTGTNPATNQPCGMCEKGAEIDRAQFAELTWRQMMPAHFRDLTLSSHPNRDLARQVATWWKHKPITDGTNLVIQGAVGTGKTGAAIGALREAHFTIRPKTHPDEATTYYGVRYWNLVNLIDRFKDEMDQTIPINEKARTVLMSCDLLLLDDIGVERMTDYVKERLYAIVNERYVRGLPTIFTSNRSGAAFEEYFDQRITDRIFERCTLITGKPTWKNLRRRK